MMTSESPEAKRPPGFLRKDFICYVCQLKVTGKKALVTHMKEIHKEDKCRFCDFKTEWNHRLKDHELRLHEEIKPSFPCDMCKYETVSLSALIWHKKIHLKEKFSCKDCQFEADAIIELRKHRKTQHVENKKIYSCEQCTYETPSECNFQRHTASHVKAKDEKAILNCNVCD